MRRGLDPESGRGGSPRTGRPAVRRREARFVGSGQAGEELKKNGPPCEGRPSQREWSAEVMTAYWIEFAWFPSVTSARIESPGFLAWAVSILVSFPTCSLCSRPS